MKEWNNMPNSRAQASGAKWHVNTFNFKTSVRYTMTSECIAVQHFYQVYLQFKQVTITLFLPLVPQRSPSGPTNSAPQQALLPLNPFLSQWIDVELHLGHFAWFSIFQVYLFNRRENNNFQEINPIWPHLLVDRGTCGCRLYTKNFLVFDDDGGEYLDEVHGDKNRYKSYLWQTRCTEIINLNLVY